MTNRMNVFEATFPNAQIAHTPAGIRLFIAIPTFSFPTTVFQ